MIPMPKRIQNLTSHLDIGRFGCKPIFMPLRAPLVPPPASLPATEASLFPLEGCRAIVPRATPLPRPKDVDLVLYHANCSDGFTAAWAAWKKLGDKAQYVPVNYFQDPPDVTGRNVAIVDFSYERPVMEALLASARSLVVLDHHKTGEANLAGIPNAVFDKEHSGAALSWNFFHPGIAPPDLVRFAEMADLFHWEEPGSREYAARIESEPYEFECYEALRHKARDEIIREGSAILDYRNVLVGKIAKAAVLKTFKGHNVLVVNCPPELVTEVGGLLSTRPECEFALIWSFNHQSDSFKISLRRDLLRSDPDLAKIAETFPGGGGHAAAASFSWKGANIKDLLI